MFYKVFFFDIFMKNLNDSLLSKLKDRFVEEHDYHMAFLGYGLGIGFRTVDGKKSFSVLIHDPHDKGYSKKTARTVQSILRQNYFLNDNVPLRFEYVGKIESISF